jgi:hypothetical protein
MIQRLAGSLFVFLLVALPAARGHAQTRSGGPFAGLDQIRLSTALGGPLDKRGGTEPQLFAGDLHRFNRFELALTTAVAAKLDSCGLFAYSEAPDELSIEVFGRREELRQCTPRYVYMIQAKVLKSNPRAPQAERETVSLRPVIGLADEAGLERSLINAAVAAVAGELQGCGRKPG